MLRRLFERLLGLFAGLLSVLIPLVFRSREIILACISMVRELLSMVWLRVLDMGQRLQLLVEHIVRIKAVIEEFVIRPVMPSEPTVIMLPIDTVEAEDHKYICCDY